MAEVKISAPPARLAQTVVLVGMMGSGKTAVGKALAAELSVPFRDSDDALEEAANMTIPEIFERDGEAFFRQKEAQIIARLMESGPGVLSTGGGAFLNPDTRAVIAARGVSVWLKADAALLWERVRHKDSRPLLRTADPKGTLIALLEARKPHYACADLAVEARDAYSIADMTRAVIQALMARPGVFEGSGQ